MKYISPIHGSKGLQGWTALCVAALDRLSRLQQRTSGNLQAAVALLLGELDVLPEGFQITAMTDDAVNAFENAGRNIYGVQFHPEVAHTPLGAQILRNFLFEICECAGHTVHKFSQRRLTAD